MCHTVAQNTRCTENQLLQEAPPENLVADRGTKRSELAFWHVIFGYPATKVSGFYREVSGIVEVSAKADYTGKS